MYQYRQPYYGPRYSGCVKFLMYGASLLFPLVGLIIWIIMMSRQDYESKRLGNTCLILSIISFLGCCCLGAGTGVFGTLMEGFQY